MKSVLEFRKRKNQNQKISLLTCYDYTFARLLNASQIDALLVGDTLAMTMYGHKTTLPATIEKMAWHVEAVARGAPDKFVIGDMPFLSFRKGLRTAMNAVEALMKAGAQAVKLEGGFGNERVIQHITRSGIPVMGHIGLTPQAFHAMGGFLVQGKDDESARHIIAEAELLQELGCFSVVLECVPAQLAQRISQKLVIPTIGIGAGPHTDGQVLILQDMLGLNQEFSARFVKQYTQGFEHFLQACNAYDQEVKDQTFPSAIHCYGAYSTTPVQRTDDHDALSGCGQ